MLVADQGTGRILEVGAGGDVRERATLPGVRRIQVAADGSLVALGAGGLHREDRAGELRPWPVDGAPAAAVPTDVAMHRDGSAWVTFRLASGTGEALFVHRSETGWQAQGSLPGRTCRGLSISAAGTPVAVVANASGAMSVHVRSPEGAWRLWRSLPPGAGRAQLDAAGRVYVVELLFDSLRARLVRYDSPEAAPVVIAGPGGRIFTGDTVQTGLSIEVPDLVVEDSGALLLADTAAGQVKRIPGAVLEP
jgi:hypothetical protein